MYCNLCIFCNLFWPRTSFKLCSTGGIVLCFATLVRGIVWWLRYHKLCCTKRIFTPVQSQEPPVFIISTTVFFILLSIHSLKFGESSIFIEQVHNLFMGQLKKGCFIWLSLIVIRNWLSGIRFIADDFEMTNLTSFFLCLYTLYFSSEQF